MIKELEEVVDILRFIEKYERDRVPYDYLVSVCKPEYHAGYSTACAIAACHVNKVIDKLKSSSVAENYSLQLEGSNLSDRELTDVMATVWTFFGGDAEGFNILKGVILNKIKEMER